MSRAHSFSYSRAHSPNFPSLHLRHNSFSNPSVDSPTSQLILQPFFRFSYVTSSSLNSPDEPPMQFITLNTFITSNYFKNLVIVYKLKASVCSSAAYLTRKIVRKGDGECSGHYVKASVACSATATHDEG